MFKAQIILALESIKPTSLPGADGTSHTSQDEVTNILKIVFAVLGALAVLAVTLAGLRYITAAGDPQKTAQAKNAIIYSLVGIAIAVGAEGIITFVLGQLG